MKFNIYLWTAVVTIDITNSHTLFLFQIQIQTRTRAIRILKKIAEKEMTEIAFFLFKMHACQLVSQLCMCRRHGKSALHTHAHRLSQGIVEFLAEITQMSLFNFHLLFTFLVYNNMS